MKGFQKVMCIGGAGILGSNVLNALSSGYSLTNVDYK
jgi:hypothetical protein